MRHANPKTTLLLYSQASSENLRSAQGKVMEMVRWASMPEKPDVQEQPQTAIVR